MDSKARAWSLSRISWTNPLLCGSDTVWNHWYKCKTKDDVRCIFTWIRQALLLWDHLRFDESRIQGVHDQIQIICQCSRDLFDVRHDYRTRPNSLSPWDWRASSSAKKDGTWTTTPDPISPVHLGLTSPSTEIYQITTRQYKSNDVPLGKRWKANVVLTFSGPIGTTIVWPALLPPAHRAQTSISADRISTNFPFPSSPHCEPSTTVTANPAVQSPNRLNSSKKANRS